MKTFIKKILAAALTLFTVIAKAQCGAPPNATVTATNCSGQSTVDIFLGGNNNYNVQTSVDYQNPLNPVGGMLAYNVPGPVTTISNVPSGQNKFYIVDQNLGCYDSVSFTAPGIFNMSVQFQNNLSDCNDLGLLTVMLAGGMTPYTLQTTTDNITWTTVSTGSNTVTTTNLSPGTYGIRTVDANGCINETPQQLGVVPDSNYLPGQIFLCPVEDSSVTYLTGGNQTLSHNISLTKPGWVSWADSVVVIVDFGDGNSTGVATTLQNAASIPVSNTYTMTGVYTVTYTMYSLNGSSLTSTVTEFVNNNSDVYPGDANGDGVANNVDLLNVGIAFGSNGVARPGASLSWTAQPCTDWTQNFNSGLNYKHADCDGNATVGYSDTVAIVQNYGMSHILKQGNIPSVMNPSDPSLEIDFPAGNYPSGSTVTVNVSLGNATVPANNIYGVAFTVNYPLAVVDANNIGVDFSNCWMGTVGTNAAAISKNFPGIGSIDIGITKTDQLNVTGYGTVCELSIVTIDNVSGKMNSAAEYFTISKLMLIDKDGNVINANAGMDSATVNQTVGITQKETAKFNVYPNPASDVLYVSADEPIREIIVTDISGRMVMTTSVTGEIIVINTTGIENGFYIVNMKTETASYSKTVEIVR